MTENEVETQEHQQNNKEDIDYDKLRTNWGMNVTKSTVRLKIWQILQLFGEMNVTQISNLLKESKSTVSRHLVGMVEDRLVSSREDKSCCEGRIPPKVFTIEKKIMSKGSMQEIKFPEELDEQINFIKAEIQTNRSSIDMITGIMKLLHPIYNEIELLIKTGDDASHAK
ncbi:MAG: helix-turn-helix domain-containing protein, partial [Promethearchaeota archaeon]